jgi:hypothetical protein
MHLGLVNNAYQKVDSGLCERSAFLLVTLLIILIGVRVKFSRKR